MREIRRGVNKVTGFFLCFDIDNTYSLVGVVKLETQQE